MMGHCIIRSYCNTRAGDVAMTQNHFVSGKSVNKQSTKNKLTYNFDGFHFRIKFTNSIS